MKVHCNEGVAIHIGPKPCVPTREGVGEASVGVRAGQPWSRERISLQGADAVRRAEGHTGRHASASAPAALRGRRPWHARTLVAREPGDLRVGPCRLHARVRIGKARSPSR